MLFDRILLDWANKKLLSSYKLNTDHPNSHRQGFFVQSGAYLGF